MLPAYEKLGDELIILQGSGKNERGLSYYPKGKEYYLYLVRSNTGSYRDMKEIKMIKTEEQDMEYIVLLFMKNLKIC